MTRKCEDLNDLITQLKNDLARRTEEAEGRLAEQKDELEKSLRESVQSILNKNLNFYQQFKEDLTKLDKLKSKIIKEVKDNRSAFDSFDT
jgi:F0F1-type ATP synthase membrane subunit b/b'